MKDPSLRSGYVQQQWKAKTFRIGHMGDIPLEDLSAMLSVLTEVVS